MYTAYKNLSNNLPLTDFAMNKITILFLLLFLVGELTAQDINAANPVQELSILSQDTNAEGLAFNATGTKLFILSLGGSLSEFALTTPFALNSATFSRKISLSSADGNNTDVAFNATGTKLFLIGRSRDNVYQYSLSNPFDPSTASFSKRHSIKGQENNPQGLAFSADGKHMYVVGNTGKDINQYRLATAFDVKSASYIRNFSIAQQDANPTSLVFNLDGTRLYLLGNGGDRIYQYNLGNAYEVNTASYINNLSIGTQEFTPTGITMGSNGHLYIVGKGNFKVVQFQLGNTGGDPDNDSDGIPASQDCNDNDPNLTTIGATCNDGNSSTNNDLVTANCQCEGTIIDPDHDGDGIPASQDCNDNDPNLTTTGATCDDGNPNTSNDKVTANCACVGTINDPDNDGDNVPVSQDCNDNDPNVSIIGASCNDDNPNTSNDIVTANCLCQGTTTGGNGSSVWTDHTDHISYNQKVLIGSNTNLPDGYNLFVEEGILAKKLKLALPNTTAWADYVFEDNYELRPIQEVEDFVKQHKHLPNVPSAKELGEEGIDIVTMNATLLRQIEELWLHMIDLKKENAELKKLLLEKK